MRLTSARRSISLSLTDAEGQAAALILTVGVVAAVVLTLRHRTGVRHQKPSQQVLVNARDRIRVVKMAAVAPAAPQPEPGKETTP